MSGLRSIEGVFLVAAPSGKAITTRIRTSDTDEVVLNAVADLVSRLRRRDLRARTLLGLHQTKEQRAARKRELTAATTSRWAGSIIRHNDAQWALARRGMVDHAHTLRAAITTITARLAAPVGGHAPAPAGSRRKKVKGYATHTEKATKQRRLQHLRARLARVEADLAAGRVHIVEGGARLARNRHHLDAAGLTLDAWRARWDTERGWFHANGSKDEPFGNGTITITDEGEVSIRLPEALTHLANAPRGRYRLTHRAYFRHDGDAWAAHITSGPGEPKAVSYRFHRRPGRAGWYITASWTPDGRPTRAPATDTPTAGANTATSDVRPDAERVLAIDTNADHLAAWVVDRHGNPCGAPITVGWDLTGATSRRDAHVRHAITRLIHIARTRGCDAIVIEQLGFDDARATGRETMGRGSRGKTFRRTVAGIPTRIFCHRLAAMTAKAGIDLYAVNPAYTSKWAREHWLTPLTAHHQTTTGHTAAAVVIGRRAYGHKARRRAGNLTPRPEERARVIPTPTAASPAPYAAKNPAPMTQQNTATGPKERNGSSHESVNRYTDHAPPGHTRVQQNQ